MSNLDLIKEAYQEAVKNDHTFTEDEARIYHPVISRLWQVIKDLEN
jgi:hypothetical protein